MIVSVGLVVENNANIVPLKIGGIEDNADIFDLAVIYTQSEASLLKLVDTIAIKHLFIL